MPYIDQKTAEELEALGHLLSDEIHEDEPTGSTPTTTAPPAATVPAVNTAEIQEQIAQAESEGNWQLAFSLKNQWLEQNGTYEGKPDVPQAPAAAPAPEPLTADQLHAAIQEAEKNGEVMKSISLKSQLLTARRNR
jgi:hypothetical protein